MPETTKPRSRTLFIILLARIKPEISIVLMFLQSRPFQHLCRFRGATGQLSTFFAVQDRPNSVYL